MEFAKYLTLGAWFVYWGGFLLIENFESSKNQANNLFDPRSKKPFIWLIILLFFIYTIFWLGIGGLGNNTVAILAGIVLLFSGVGFSIISRYYLGAGWSFLTIVSGKEPFAQNGPYKFVRHPIYLGLFIIWLGSSLVFFNWIGLISGFIILLPLLYYRAKIEEENLTKVFGQIYLDYIRRSGMIFPKIRFLSKR